MSTEAENRWMEARGPVVSAITEMKEAGDGVGIDALGVAEDIADIVFDELGITLREDGV